MPNYQISGSVVYECTKTSQSLQTQRLPKTKENSVFGRRRGKAAWGKRIKSKEKLNESLPKLRPMWLNRLHLGCPFSVSFGHAGALSSSYMSSSCSLSSLSTTTSRQLPCAPQMLSHRCAGLKEIGNTDRRRIIPDYLPPIVFNDEAIRNLRCVFVILFVSLSSLLLFFFSFFGLVASYWICSFLSIMWSSTSSP